MVCYILVFSDNDCESAEMWLRSPFIQHQCDAHWISNACLSPPTWMVESMANKLWIKWTVAIDTILQEILGLVCSLQKEIQVETSEYYKQLCDTSIHEDHHLLHDDLLLIEFISLPLITAKYSPLLEVGSLSVALGGKCLGHEISTLVWRLKSLMDKSIVWWPCWVVRLL